MINIHTKIQDAIYDILCNYKYFKIGSQHNIKDIYKIVIPLIQSNLVFKDMEPDYIKHNIRQVIQTRSNSIRNKNYAKYNENGLIKRDIASIIYEIKGKRHSNQYIFGCLL